jgi:serine/threonine protein kinase
VILELAGIAARPSFEDRYELRARLWLDGPHAGYLALDRVLGREVMLNVAYRTRDAEAMIEKGRILALLQHPNILPVFDLGVTGEGLPYFTRPGIRLEPMDEIIRRLERGGRFPDRDFPLKPIVASVRDACRAVIHTRALGYYHDDLHPGAILVGGEPREVFVADGWARIRREAGGDRANPDPPGFRCRLEYVDPMRARDLKESYEPQDDVFAFGGILHLILYGTPPNHFPGISDAGKRLQAIASRASQPREPGTIRPGIRSRGWWRGPSIRRLERICLRALDSDLARRQRDVEELTRELDGWIDGRWGSDYSGWADDRHP